MESAKMPGSQITDLDSNFASILDSEWPRVKKLIFHGKLRFPGKRKKNGFPEFFSQLGFSQNSIFIFEISKKLHRTRVIEKSSILRHVLVSNFFV